MNKFYFHFLHPGKEFEYKKRKRAMSIYDINLNTPYKSGYIHPIIEDGVWGVRFGNEHPTHKKKFILQKGHYIHNDTDVNINTMLSNVTKDEYLYFWGEWEPQSFFKLTNFNNENFPSQIHYPFFVNKDLTGGIGCHSTDPYVYNNFYYTHCKQGLFSQPKRLDKYLKSKDLEMIIFGYEFPFSVKPNQYIIDTLIVVDKKQSHSSFVSPKSNIFDITNYYWGKHPDLSNYKGYRYDNPEKNVFSFVPCIPFKNNKILNRPFLDTYKYGLQKPGARTGGKPIPLMNNNELIDIWVNIVKDIFEQKWSLGVQITEPFEFPNYQDAYKHFLTIKKSLKI